MSDWNPDNPTGSGESLVGRYTVHGVEHGGFGSYEVRLGEHGVGVYGSSTVAQTVADTLNAEFYRRVVEQREFVDGPDADYVAWLEQRHEEQEE